MQSILIVEQSQSLTALITAHVARDLMMTVVSSSDFAETKVLIETTPEPFLVVLWDLDQPGIDEEGLVDYLWSHTTPMIGVTRSHEKLTPNPTNRIGRLDCFDREDPNLVYLLLHAIRRLQQNHRWQILVVDDSRSARFFLGHFLARYGFTIHQARNGSEALERIVRQKIDLVITSFELAGISGVALTKKLRTRFTPEEMAIIGLATMTVHKLAVHFLQAGASDFLTKPYEPEEILSRVYQNIDLIERQRTQKLLMERHSSVLTYSLDAIVTADEDGRVLDYNPAAETLFGFKRHAVIGGSLSKLLALPSWSEVSKALEEIRKDGIGPPGHRHLEVQCERADGKILVMQLSLVSFGQHGQRSFAAIIHDIIDRQQLLNSVRRSLAEAQKASKTKSEFLANMSHEIRSPMNIVIGMSRQLGRTALTPRQRDYVEKIHSASAHLLGIINDILDISKIEANKLQLEAVPFCLEELLGKHATLFEFKAQEKGLSFRFRLADEVPRGLIGDPLRLGQILNNLVFNAIKFTESGEILVTVALLSLGNNVATLRFAVTDSGIGMSPEQIPHLFQPFHQADMSTTRKFGGTGLGLAICKRLTETMGGSIAVESALGKGSTFSFTVMQALATAPIPAAESLQDAPELAWQLRRICGRRVMVVDDIPTNQELIRELLEELGLVVGPVVNHGRAAVEAIAASSEYPDLILMDLQMPEMDGIEATRQIRKLENTAQLPIIAMTADAMVSDRERCLAGGMNGHLAKPIDLPALHACLVKWLKPNDQALAAPLPEGVDPTSARLSTTPTDPSAHPVILVMEDDPGDLDGLRDLLARDYTLQSAPDDRSLRELATGNPPDLILYAMNTPEQDGQAFCAWLKGTPPTRELPVILMSRSQTVGEEARCLQAGADDYIRKPIPDLTVVRLRVARLLAGKRPIPPALGGEPEAPPEPLAGEAAASKISRPDRQETRGGSLPERLDGIDREAALARLGGKQRLLRSLLLGMARDFADAGSHLRTLLFENPDLESAQRLAHSVKGIAGNVSARELFDAALALEKAIQESRKEEWPDRVEGFERALARILATTATLQGPPPSSTAPVAAGEGAALPDLEQVGPVWQQLSRGLAAGSLQSRRHFATLEGLLAGFAPGAEAMHQLRTCLGQFNFKGARAPLDALGQLLGLSLDQGG